MTPEVPPDLLTRAGDWGDLHRWERSELGKMLRRLGLTYGEIREIIPVPKGTLSYWCRDIALTDGQVSAIKDRSQGQSGVPKDTQWKRRLEIEDICREARNFAYEHLDDAFFVAGVALYWGEGSKTRNDFALTNSDPATLRFFVRWTRSYIQSDAVFVLAMHLHEGNDEAAARDHWRRSVGLYDAPFTRTFIKPRSTGHRKNHLEHGVCRVRARNGADKWNRVMTWIEVVAARFAP